MSNQVPVEPAECCDVGPLLREPLTAHAATAIAATLKALADPVRLRLFSAIASRANGEACVCDISDGLDVKQPTVSHHLKVLRDAGLLTSERRASWVYYAVAPEALHGLAALFAAGPVHSAAGATA
jgi:ArsR family transcriptional regulator, arsenate/arsenite/antimonite-responsive transcriptional repressor